MSVSFSLQLINFALGNIHGSEPVSRLEQQVVILPTVIPGSTKKGLSNDASFCFLKNLKERLQRSMKCLSTASDGRVWGGPEMYRMVLKQKAQFVS